MLPVNATAGLTHVESNRAKGEAERIVTILDAHMHIVFRASSVPASMGIVTTHARAAVRLRYAGKS